MKNGSSRVRAAVLAGALCVVGATYVAIVHPAWVELEKKAPTAMVQVAATHYAPGSAEDKAQRAERTAAMNRARLRGEEMRQEEITSAVDDVWKRLEVRSLKGHTDGVTSVAFSPDGKLLASGSGDTTVRLWDVATGKEVKKLAAHRGAVMTVRFSPDGKYLVSGGLDQQVIAWDVSTGEVLGIEQQECPCYDAGFLADSDYFVSTCGEHLRLWKLGEPGQVRVMEAPAMIDSLALAADGSAITGDSSGTVTLWDTSTGQALLRKQRKAWAHGDNVITELSVLPGGDVLVTDSGRHWRWNVQTNTMADLGEGIDERPVCMVNGTELVAACGNAIWVHKAGENVIFHERILPVEKTGEGMPGLGDYIASLAVSPDGKWIAIGYGGSVNRDAEWMTCGPRDVEMFSMPALLKWYQERTGGRGAARRTAERATTQDSSTEQSWQ